MSTSRRAKQNNPSTLCFVQVHRAACSLDRHGCPSEPGVSESLLPHLSLLPRTPPMSTPPRRPLSSQFLRTAQTLPKQKKTGANLVAKPCTLLHHSCCTATQNIGVTNGRARRFVHSKSQTNSPPANPPNKKKNRALLGKMDDSRVRQEKKKEEMRERAGVRKICSLRMP